MHRTEVAGTVRNGAVFRRLPAYRTLGQPDMPLPRRKPWRRSPPSATAVALGVSALLAVGIWGAAIARLMQ
jgi:hypothetical protein